MSDEKKPEMNEQDKARAERDKMRYHELLNNALMARQDLMRKMCATGDAKDLNKECGYPDGDTVPLEMLREYYLREGIAKRVVSLYPEECWALDPEIFETEKQEETAFEKAWAELRDRLNIFHYLERIDRISGIGEYGVLLLGIKDGKTLDQPAAGLNEQGERVGTPSGVELMFLRTRAQTSVEIDKLVEDETNPRYGLPLTYQLVADQNKKIHWTRVIHIADNVEEDEVRGIPRQTPSFNRIVDIRKLLGGSAEMFWKGGFPGVVFEVSPDVIERGGEFGEKEREELADQYEKYQAGLQRVLAVLGMTAKNMEVQVADPKSHVEIQLLLIAVTLGCPLRILLGSEEAKLASSQDIRTWNKRLKRRQTRYLTPMLLFQLIDRLIALGVLPEPGTSEPESTGENQVSRPVRGYQVWWPDLFAPSEDDKATTQVKIVDALVKYIAGNVAQLIPPLEFLTRIMGFELEEVEEFLKSAEDWVAEHEEELKAAAGIGEKDEDEEEKGGKNDEQLKKGDKKGGE